MGRRGRARSGLEGWWVTGGTVASEGVCLCSCCKLRLRQSSNV